MIRLTELQENWRGMTVSSVFQIPGFTILIVVLLAVGVTMLLSGNIDDVAKTPKQLANPLHKENRKILFDATSEE
jgi:hypothetical protein